jgi:Tfp pilus assembly protein PilO
VKRKLAALDLRLQLGLVAVALVLFGAAGYVLVISPQHAKAVKLQRAAEAAQAEIYHRQAELRSGAHPPTIKTADLFQLGRAMPDREDMPGIILTLSEVARAAGIKFDLIEPVTSSSTTPTVSFTPVRIHLLFNGDFYGLSDFLYRLRSLVAVHHGTLEASGRLFDVDTLTFNVQGNTFPQISAELYVDAYIYSTTPVTPTTAAAAPTTPSSTDTATSSGATAAGLTP